EEEVFDYDTAKKSDLQAFNIFFISMLEQGIYLAPSQFEAGFVSMMHSQADIDATINASDVAFQKVKEYLDSK
ncbi:aspartate aminotransferase family protein, partial [Selenomonadales bacterium OttesenSCG-928-I06]|nr:aspartate aminotransferase family protein [Selenomonadales bacterium OttesenSCG-928-I06]